MDPPATRGPVSRDSPHAHLGVSRHQIADTALQRGRHTRSQPDNTPGRRLLWPPGSGAARPVLSNALFGVRLACPFTTATGLP